MNARPLSFLVVTFTFAFVTALDGCRLLAHDIACDTDANCPDPYTQCLDHKCVVPAAGEGEGNVAEGEGEGVVGEGEGNVGEGEGEGVVGEGEGEGEGVVGEGEGEGEGAAGFDLGVMQPPFPGADTWLAWVVNDGSGAACPSTASNCTFVGSIRQVTTNQISDCAGLTMSDELRAFQWLCFAGGNSVVIQGALDAKHGLVDLIEPDGAGGYRFKTNRLVVQDAGGAVLATSQKTAWWSDPVVPLLDAQASPPQNAIGVVDHPRTNGVTLASHAGLVVVGGGSVAVQQGAAVFGSQVSSAYVEGAFVANLAPAIDLESCDHVLVNHALLLSNAAGLVVNGGLQDVASGMTFLPTAFDPTTQSAGVQIAGGSGHALANVEVVGASRIGVTLASTTAAQLDDVRVFGVGMGVGNTDASRRGILLTGTTATGLSRIIVASGDGSGVELSAGSNNNALAGVTAGALRGDGVVVTDSNDNTLQSIAAVNVARGVVMQGPSHGNLLVDAVLFADESAAFLSDAQGPPGSNSVQGRFANVGVCDAAPPAPVDGACNGPANATHIDASAPYVVGFVDDAATSSGTGPRQLASIPPTDLITFERDVRAFGVSGNDVRTAAARGPCVDACRVIDWASDPAGILEAGRAPGDNPSFTIVDGLATVRTTAGLAELGGNNDLVCNNALDFCLALVHVGGFQGEGVLVPLQQPQGPGGALIGVLSQPD